MRWSVCWDVEHTRIDAQPHVHPTTSSPPHPPHPVSHLLLVCPDPLRPLIQLLRQFEGVRHNAPGHVGSKGVEQCADEAGLAGDAQAAGHNAHNLVGAQDLVWWVCCGGGWDVLWVRGGVGGLWGREGGTALGDECGNQKVEKCVA